MGTDQRNCGYTSDNVGDCGYTSEKVWVHIRESIGTDQRMGTDQGLGTELLLEPYT